MPPTGQAPSSASDSSAAHKPRQIQRVRDGNSKEADSGDTMEGCSRCDMPSFSPPSLAHGHCAPKAVSRGKLEKLRNGGSLTPAAAVVVSTFRSTTLAVGPDRRAALSDGGRERLRRQIKSFEIRVVAFASTARHKRIGYRTQQPGPSGSVPWRMH